MLLQNCLIYMEYLFGQIISNELDPDCNCNLCYTCKTISYFTGQWKKETVSYSKNV